jgi:hypothetical protein
VRRLLAIAAATWFAITLAVLGALLLNVAGAIAGAFLGGLVVGRARRVAVLPVAVAWAVFVGLGGAMALMILPHQTEFASFGATAILFIPGGFVGGLGAGVVEGLAARRAFSGRTLRVFLAHGLATAVAAMLFRLGFAFVGIGLAGLIYGAITAE